MPYIDEVTGALEIGPARMGSHKTLSTPTEELEQNVLAGDELHASLTALAWRGMNETELVALMERSAARLARPEDWQKRLADIPRLVRDAAEKRLAEAARVFSTPLQPPGTARDVTMPGTKALPVMLPADMARMPVSPREWVVPGLIPRGEPTLLFGTGATGKSLLLYQLCICVAAGVPWLARPIPPGRALFFTCEDSVDELNRRGASILSALALSWNALGDRLAIVPMRGAIVEAVLAVGRADGTLAPTATYEALRAIVSDFAPDVVVIDTLADAFAGDENRRTEAKQFVNLVARLKPDATCIVTAHPSVSGMADGRGSSGSTGWPAAVRSHLYLGRVFEDGHEPEPDVRRLSNLKGNYGRAGAGEITVRWVDGCFEAVDGGTPPGALTADDTDALFVSLLRTYTAQGRYVNSAGGTTYAPAMFATEPEAKARRVTKRQFRDAMQRLFTAGRIVTKTRSVNRRERTFIVAKEDALRE